MYRGIVLLAFLALTVSAGHKDDQGNQDSQGNQGNNGNNPKDQGLHDNGKHLGQKKHGSKDSGENTKPVVPAGSIALPSTAAPAVPSITDAPKGIHMSPPCLENEIYTECGTCEDSCDSGEQMCTMDCKPVGCYCLPPFVRHNGDCISVDQCGSATVSF
ncbi:hypothetical protein QR680_015804 [Steinernema hermaphroditum]|uniref:TIL domain-containing protein n=1 Tax=Steinernema hermaphroditum TaxID=289476 RepID=A0AA39HB56_9BILA|nr:hypothetical protein QR680_015804 [Steinernema hermaphroditum]